MRVLGLDPGSIKLGWAVIDKGRDRLKLVAAGTIRPAKGKDLPVRLLEIDSKLSELIARFSPDTACVEKVFNAKNPKSAFVLAHARGVALLAAARSGLNIYEYTPLDVKKSVTGYGGATKDQISRMIKTMFPDFDGGEDASDAAAVAVCHLNRAALTSALENRGAL